MFKPMGKKIITILRTLNTQHLDTSFNLCLKKEGKTDHFGCMFKSVHL